MMRALAPRPNDRRQRAATRAAQQGGFAVGLIVGLLLGLAIALGVALYIAKVPVPFVDKVGHRTAEQDAAEAERLKNWDPNAPLVPPPTPQTDASGNAVGGGPVLPPPADVPTSRRDPAAILSGRDPAAPPTAPPGVDPFIYYMQAGAFSKQDDAEAVRARLAMQGLNARLSTRERNGAPVYRVRIGPFDTRQEAENQAERVRSAGAEATLVRVERPR